MTWRNVRLIVAREIRDQLRDRRTLFMVLVLPILLYPLLGLAMFQVSQFVQRHPVRVLLVDPPNDAIDAPLTVADGERRSFHQTLFHEPADARLLRVTETTATSERRPDAINQARAAVLAGDYDVAVIFPEAMTEKLQELRQRLAAATLTEPQPAASDDSFHLPSPEIYFSTQREASSVGSQRVFEILQTWNIAIGQANLAAHGFPPAAARPFTLQTHDLAKDIGQRGAALWSKMLPFLLLIWALTGAFYPAVDVCAGEKERGTLETLLTSPAARSEIVLGKLLTVMSFSVATAVLNLLSMGLTGRLVLSQLPQFGPPPPQAPLWLAVALLPMSALFSAVCVALATFARSGKEGHYYLMPVLLITMPLVVLPMSPGFQLNLGNSLVPVSGVVLLLKAALEGQPWREILPYIPPVAASTLLCCFLAIRWAVDQFNSESVLFRENERFELQLWLRHLIRDRGATPNAAMAMFAGLLILMLRFVLGFLLPHPRSFHELALLAVATQLAVILVPALLLTGLLTKSYRATLQLRWPGFRPVAAAGALALLLHPLVNVLQQAVQRLYPVNEELTRLVANLLGENPSWPLLFMAMALLPAICEELAFRGFVLTGLSRAGNAWRAVLVSSVLFGATHSILQQSMVAALVGLVLGYVAWQTRSIWPGMVYHVLHNSLALLVPRWHADAVEQFPWLRGVLDTHAQGLAYHPLFVVVCSLLAVALLFWFWRQSARRWDDLAFSATSRRLSPALEAELSA